MSVSNRKQFEKVLQDALPKGWRFEPYTDALGAIEQTTLMLRKRRTQADPSAPYSHRVIEFVVTVISPKTNTDEAEADLDDLEDTLLRIFDNTAGLWWEDSELVRYSEQNLALDITLFVRFAINT